MLTAENRALRIAAFQGEDLGLLLEDVNHFIQTKEQAGCSIADIKPTETMTSRPQMSEYDTELYYHTHTIYVLYHLERPSSEAPAATTSQQEQPAP